MLREAIYPIFGLLALIPQLSIAFNPTWVYTGGGIVGHPHQQMTFQGVTTKLKEYFDVDEFAVTNSMNSARSQIIDGTAIVDHHGDKEAELGEAHCDDETLQLCHIRLNSNLTIIRDLLQSGNVSIARERLGRMLHTLQDFYSHSNWIELGMTDISLNLAQKWPLERPVDETKIRTSCRNCTYPDSLPVAVKWELDFDDWVRSTATFDDDPMSGTSKGFVTAMMAAKQYGITAIVAAAAKYGLKLPPQLLADIARISDSLLNVKPDCKASLVNPFDSQFLTTGYFGTELHIHSVHKPPGKCSHGGQYDRDTNGIEGISKDTASAFLSPRFDKHPEAARLALKATKQYLDYVKTSVCGDTVPKDCVLLKALYGIGPSLTFVIDTTGSMGSVIAAVRDAAIRIVNQARTLPAAESPSLYVLAPFNDPVVPVAAAYTDPDRFIEAILALDASGGGDCPELAMAGLQNAVQATPAGGKIFLWTDAAAKDAAIAGEVGSAAAQKSLSVTVFQFTSGCETVAGFDAVTQLTDGSLYSGLAYSDAGSTASKAEISANQDFITLVKITLNKVINAVNSLPRRAGARSITFELPVDPSLSFLGFSTNSSAINMTISRPDGSVLSAADAGVTFLSFGEGVTETVTSPAPGIWKITLTGDAALSFSAFGTTSLLFSRFDFVESAGGRHDGLFPVATSPLPGATDVLTMASLEGVPTANGSVTFEFRGLDGQVLETLTGIAPGSGADMDIPTNVFLGNVTVPSEAFNVYARGKDTAGNSFLRMLPGLLDLPSAPTRNGTVGGNSTLPSNPTASSSIYYRNSTISATRTATSLSKSGGTTLCSTCQPPPCTTAVAELTRTVMYFTPCPGADGKPSSALATTEILVPCYGSCPTSLAAISPGGYKASGLPGGSTFATAVNATIKNIAVNSTYSLGVYGAKATAITASAAHTSCSGSN